MTDPFEQELSAALRAQAAELPYGRGLGEVAVAGAHRVRRRRVAVTGAAVGAVAIAAISASVLQGGNAGERTVIPGETTPSASATITPSASATLSAGVGPTSPSTTPTPSTVPVPSAPAADPPQLADGKLRLGGAPHVPVLTITSPGRFAVVDGGKRVTWQGKGRPVDGFRVDGGWVVRLWLDGGYTVTRVGEDGSTATVLHGADVNLVKQPDGSILSAAVDGADTALRVVGATTVTRVPGHWRPAGFVDADRLVLTPATYEDADKAAAPLWSVSRHEVVGHLPQRLRPRAASAGLVVGDDLTKAGPVDGEPCGVVVSLDAPDTDLWASCDLTPYVLTPGGRTALMLPTYFDGLGAGRLALLDLGSRALVGDWLVFTKNHVVEDDTHVLFLAQASTTDYQHYAVVRCDDTGTCERASPVMVSTADAAQWETTLLDP